MKTKYFILAILLMWLLLNNLKMQLEAYNLSTVSLTKFYFDQATHHYSDAGRKTLKQVFRKNQAFEDEFNKTNGKNIRVIRIRTKKIEYFQPD